MGIRMPAQARGPDRERGTDTAAGQRNGARNAASAEGEEAERSTAFAPGNAERIAWLASECAPTAGPVPDPTGRGLETMREHARQENNGRGTPPGGAAEDARTARATTDNKSASVLTCVVMAYDDILNTTNMATPFVSAHTRHVLWYDVWNACKLVTAMQLSRVEMAMTCDYNHLAIYLMWQLINTIVYDRAYDYDHLSITVVWQSLHATAHNYAYLEISVVNGHGQYALHWVHLSYVMTGMHHPPLAPLCMWHPCCILNVRATFSCSASRQNVRFEMAILHGHYHLNGTFDIVHSPFVSMRQWSPVVQCTTLAIVPTRQRIFFVQHIAMRNGTTGTMLTHSRGPNGNFLEIALALQLSHYLHHVATHCGALGSTVLLNSRMPRKTKQEGSRAKDGGIDMQSLNRAVQQVITADQAQAGAACGLGRDEDDKKRRIQNEVERLNRVEEQRKAAQEQARAQEKAVRAVMESQAEIRSSPNQLDERVAQAAAKGLQAAISGIDNETAKQTARKTFHLANASANTITVQRMIRETSVADEEVRVRLVGPPGAREQVMQQAEKVKKWAKEQGYDHRDQTPQADPASGFLILLFAPQPEMVAAILATPQLQIAEVAVEAKIVRPPRTEIDVHPQGTEELKKIAQHARMVGLNVLELEKFLEQTLKASLKSEDAALVEYVRIELTRVKSSEGPKRLDVFDLGKFTMGPRITMGVADELQRKIGMERIMASITMGPHDALPVATARVALSKNLPRAEEGPVTQKEAMSRIREALDESNKQFESEMQELGDGLRAAEGDLDGAGEAQAKTQLRKILTASRFWKEQGMIEATAAEYETLMEAVEQNAAPDQIKTALQGFVAALNRYRDSTWSKQKGDQGILWLVPEQVDNFRLRVGSAVGKADQNRWVKELRKTLNGDKACLSGDGGTIGIEVQRIQVLVSKQGKEINLAPGFAVAVANYTAITGALMRCRGAMWPTSLKVRADLKFLNTDQPGSREGLAEKIMSLCAKGSLIFFDPQNFVDTGLMCTQLSAVEMPASAQPYHITKLHELLQVPREAIENIAEVLGQLRVGKKLRTVLIGKTSMAAYGRADILNTLARWAQHSGWTDDLRSGQDAAPVIRAELQQCIRAAVFAAAGTGCWLEEQSMAGGGGPTLQLEGKEANVLGPNMVSTVLNKFEFLLQFPDATGLVAEAVSMMLAEKSVIAIGAGQFTLLLREDSGVEIGKMQDQSHTIMAGMPLSLEALAYKEETVRSVQERLMAHISRRSIIAEGPAAPDLLHWVQVPKCPAYAKRIEAPELLHTLTTKQLNGAAGMELADWTRVMVQDELEIKPRDRVFIQERGLETGWIPAAAFSIAHAMVEPTSPAREVLAKRILSELEEEGSVLVVAAPERDKDVPWTVYVGARMRPGTATTATVPEWLRGIRISLQVSMRTAISQAGGHVSRAEITALATQKVQSVETDSLMDAICKAKAPFFLPLQPQAQLDVDKTSGDRQARQLFQAIPHPLITTQVGVAILWETLEDQVGTFHTCAGGCINAGDDSELAGIEQADLDMIDVGADDPVHQLQALLGKRQNEEDKEGEEEDAMEEEQELKATAKKKKKGGTGEQHAGAAKKDE